MNLDYKMIYFIITKIVLNSSYWNAFLNITKYGARKYDLSILQMINFELISRIGIMLPNLVQLILLMYSHTSHTLLLFSYGAIYPHPRIRNILTTNDLSADNSRICKAVEEYVNKVYDLIHEMYIDGSYQHNWIDCIEITLGRLGFSFILFFTRKC